MLLQLFLLLLLINNSINLCKQTYIVICDNLDDIKTDQFCVTWTEVQFRRLEERNNVTFQKQHLNLLKSTKRLVIIRQINSIGYAAFTQPNQILRHVIIYDNKLTRIQRHTFNLKLEKLDLRRNEIQVIDGEAFAGSRFDILDLSKNNLVALTTRVFYNLNLKHLIIENNNLTTIEPNTLPNTLVTLNLYSNLLDYDESYFKPNKRLVELTMKRNRIINNEINLSKLDNIKKLDLSFNLISKISTNFTQLKSLTYLDLSGNNLKEISLDFLENKENFTILLAFNRLNNLNISQIPIKEGTVISLYGNPWNCKCLFELEKEIFNKKIKQIDCDRKIFGSGEAICIYKENCDEKTNAKTFWEFKRKTIKHTECYSTYSELTSLSLL